MKTRFFKDERCDKKKSNIVFYVWCVKYKDVLIKKRKKHLPALLFINTVVLCSLTDCLKEKNYNKYIHLPLDVLLEQFFIHSVHLDLATVIVIVNHVGTKRWGRLSRAIGRLGVSEVLKPTWRSRANKKINTKDSKVQLLLLWMERR